MGDRLPVFRVTHHAIPAGEFAGLAYDLELKHPNGVALDLQPNYLVMVLPSADVAAGTGPDVTCYRVTADPFGTGGLAVSSAANVLQLTREANDSEAIGAVIVVECLRLHDTAGFRLRDVVVATLAASGGIGVVTDTVTAATPWTDAGQVVGFGGLRGGGATCDSNSTGAYQSVYAAITPSGTTDLTITRYENVGAAGNVKAAILPIYCVEFGSEWTVARATVTGTNNGDGSAAGHWNTLSLAAAVERASTWVWPCGYTQTSTHNASAGGAMVALGTGVVEADDETAVAVNYYGAPAGSSMLLTLLSHPDLVVSHTSRASASPALNSVDMVVAAPVSAENRTSTTAIPMTRGERATVHTGNVSTGSPPTGHVWQRPTADTTVTIERRRSAAVAWASRLQVVDFGAIVREPSDGGTLTVPDDTDPLSDIPAAYEPEHPDVAWQRLLFQFRDKPRISSLVEALGAGAQLLEDVTWELIADRELGAASGASLDQWGTLVGEARGSLDDDEYRQFIKARILANKSRGTINDLIRVFRLVTAPSTVRHEDVLPMAATFWAFRSEPMTDARAARVRRIMDDARPMGRALQLIEVPEGYFGFESDPDALGYDVGRFARII